MKGSIFLTSFFSNHCNGSKSLTSAANRTGNCEASKWVIIPAPLRPSKRPFQVGSVPMPSAVTRPTPVTTTRLFSKSKPLLGLRLVRLDVIDCVFNRRNLFGILVGDLNAESFLKRHHQFNRIQRIRAKIID